jgi:hypothetical protein
MPDKGQRAKVLFSQIEENGTFRVKEWVYPL